MKKYNRIVKVTSPYQKFKMTVSQGNLSNEVWNDPDLQEYVNGTVVFGYVGHFNRTLKTDKMLMRYQKQFNVSNKRIVKFMSWREGRHFADILSSKISQEQFNKFMGKLY